MGAENILHTPDYRLRPPWYHQLLLLAGAVCAVVAIIMVREGLSLAAGALFVVAGLAATEALLLLIILNRRSRERARRDMIDCIEWRGSEQVLDVGCGNGIVMLAAAKRLTPGQGKAVGIEIWDNKAGRQKESNLRRNAEIEGVADRIDVQQVDARKMPFAAHSFDVVFASLSLHHMRRRRTALAKMMRVLRPGGAIVIYDVWPVARHAAAALREFGATDIDHLSGTLMPVLRARKPRQ